MDERSSPPPPCPWGPRWTRIFALIVLATGALLAFRPDFDGDVWWHMAYGRQMLEHRSLRLDHTLYSWSPTSNTLNNDVNYCAWITQVVVYLAYRAFGLAGHYLFRASLLALVFWLAWRVAVRAGVERHPAFWLACVIAVQMSLLVATCRPQVVSFALVMVSAAIWRRLHEDSPGAWRYCYLFPLVMLIWVNSHPAFVIGLALFAAIGVGEALNALYTPALALPVPVRRHLVPALALSLASVTVTPYGAPYLERVLVGQATTAIYYATIAEFQSVLEANPLGMHFDQLGALSLGLLLPLTVLAARRRGLDWVAVLGGVLLGSLYVRYLRSTSFWPPFFVVLVIAMLQNAGERASPATPGRARALAGAVLALCLALLGRFLYDGIAHPLQRTFLGFGISYINPVEEAEFIDRHLAGCRLGNDYDTGAYLLWRLWPRTKIFIDSRYFPYISFDEDYQKLTSARDMESVLRRFPCDAWCISVCQTATINWFASSPNWKAAYYGASAVIFVRKGLPLPPATTLAAPGVEHIHDLEQAIRVVVVATAVRDWAGAERTLAGMESNWRFFAYHDLVAGARRAMGILRDYARRDYEACVASMDAIDTPMPIQIDTVKAISLLKVSQIHWRRHEDDRALRRAEAALALAPKDAILNYNAGAIGWFVTTRAHRSDDAWRVRLQKFLELAPPPPSTPPIALATARAILAGTANARPPLLTVGPDR